jgi:hypothetical protein
MILFLLFALTFAWSFAIMGERVGDFWSVLRIGSAVGLAISLLLLVLTFISSRRLRRTQEDEGRREEGDEGAGMGAEGEQPSTEKRGPTYEEVFGLQLDPDAGSLPAAPEDEGWPGDEEFEELEISAEGQPSEAEGQPSAEQLPAEQLPAEESAPTSEQDVEPVRADLDEAVDQVRTPDGDGESQEHLQRMREEFKARAEQAALRVKQRQAELHEAATVPDPPR